jgi:hypothetical protein
MNFSLMQERFLLIKARLREVGLVFYETYQGYCRRDELFYRACLAAAWIGFFVTIEWDVWFFKRFGLWHFYPADGIIFRLYVPLVMLFPFLLYGARIRIHKRRFAADLREVFELVGLKNALGNYPRFLSLEPITGGTMKLRVTNGAFPITEWTKRKERLEATMRVFIDEIRTVQERGIIEVMFSFNPMPNIVKVEDIFSYKKYTYFLGVGRTKSHIGDFSKSPHLLVAGQSGGGKSYFMRQMVTTIKVNQPESKFIMVDLKGGAEFGIFETVPGIEVYYSVDKIPGAIAPLIKELKFRAEALKERQITKIEDFFATIEWKKMSLEEKAKHRLGHRIFVVVDECAEIFLFGLGHDPVHTRTIRGNMSQIARLGRFVGIHVILGTQRPDKHAVDPQVKSNLTSIVSFRIPDLGGSLAILGNGRATDLPGIKGRAVVQDDGEQVEIQTPFLEFNDVIKLLEKMKPAEQVIKAEEPKTENTEKEVTVEAKEHNPLTT